MELWRWRDINREQNPTHTYTTTGTYSATLTVTDNNGANVEDSITITVKTEPDTTPPVITEVTTKDITSTSATITWLTDGASTSQVEYGDNPKSECNCKDSPYKQSTYLRANN